jgi:hypothetical protein
MTSTPSKTKKGSHPRAASPPLTAPEHPAAEQVSEPDQAQQDLTEAKEPATNDSRDEYSMDMSGPSKLDWAEETEQAAKDREELDLQAQRQGEPSKTDKADQETPSDIGSIFDPPQSSSPNVQNSQEWTLVQKQTSKSNTPKYTLTFPPANLPRENASLASDKDLMDKCDNLF